jgi:hypothetical protein
MTLAESFAALLADPAPVVTAAVGALDLAWAATAVRRETRRLILVDAIANAVAVVVVLVLWLLSPSSSVCWPVGFVLIVATLALDAFWLYGPPSRRSAPPVAGTDEPRP